MKAVKIAFIVILILVSLFFIVALFLPSKVHIARSLDMNCPASEIFEEVNNLQNWCSWSPFEEQDTAMRFTFEGPESDVGTVMKWTSPESGAGTLTIVESIHPTYIKAALDFMEAGNAECVWKFTESDTGTKVVWSLDIGDLPYPIGRYYGLAMPGIMKKTYDLGLTNLKNLCENLPEIEGVKISEIDAQQVLFIKDSSDASGIGLKLAEMYGELMAYISNKKIEIAGHPYAAFYNWDPAKPFVFDAGIPVRSPIQGEGRVEAGEIPAGKVILAPFYGPYEKTGEMHVTIQKYLELKKMSYTGPPWEVYVTDPKTETDTSKWLTLIYYRLH
jgi:effector-binding domain-containing protein